MNSDHFPYVIFVCGIVAGRVGSGMNLLLVIALSLAGVLTGEGLHRLYKGRS